MTRYFVAKRNYMRTSAVALICVLTTACSGLRTSEETTVQAVSADAGAICTDSQCTTGMCPNWTLDDAVYNSPSPSPTTPAPTPTPTPTPSPSPSPNLGSYNLYN